MIEVSVNFSDNFTTRNKLFLTYFQFMGLIPFQLNFKYSRSVFNETKVIILFVFHILVFMFSIATTKVSDEIGGVTWFAFVSIWTSINISCIVNVFEVYWKKQTQQDLLKILNKIDKHITLAFNFNLNNNEVRKAKIYKYAVIMILICISFIICGIHISDWRQLLRIVLLLLPCCTLYNRSLMLLFYLDSLLEIATLCVNKVGNLSNENEELFLTKESLQTVESFVSFYFDANEKFNDAFGWSMVFIFQQHFIGLICNTYLIFDNLSGFNEGASLQGSKLFPKINKLENN